MSDIAVRSARIAAMAHRCVALCILGCIQWSAPAQDAATFRALMDQGRRFRAVGNLRASSAKYAGAVEAAKSNTELAEALSAHALVLRQVGHDERAEEALRRAVALDTDSPFRSTAMSHLAALLEADDRLDEAVALYRGLAEKLADQPVAMAEALMGAARALCREERYEEADEFLGRLPAEGLQNHQKTQAASLAIEVLIGLDRTEEAHQAIAASAVEPFDRANLFTRLARILLDRARHDQAAKACEAALQAEPGYQLAWRVRYDAASALGKTEELEAELAAELEAEPDNEALIEQVVSIAEWNDDPNRAFETYQRLVQTHPKEPSILERAGSLAASAGKHEEAIGLYERALDIQPGDTSIYYMLGEVHAGRGDTAAAVQAWKKGVQYNLGDLNSAQRLGSLLTQHNLHEEAVAIYREAREASGQPGALAVRMAEALTALGQPEEALAEYISAASTDLDEAEMVASDAVRLAADTDLLPTLAEKARKGIAVTGAPGLALLLAVAEAAQGHDSQAAEGAVAAGLTPQELLTVAEALEFSDHRRAAGEVYAAVANHEATSPGLRLEIGLRAAQMQVSSGRLEDAAELLRRITDGSPEPRSLLGRARFLLADITLSTGGSLSEARTTFRELLAATPDVALKARWRLADCAFASGDLETAAGLYARLRDEAPEPEFPMPPLPPGVVTQVPGLMPPGMFLEEGGRDPRMTPAYAALQIAECAFRGGDMEEAKALFAGVAEQFPQSIHANNAVGRRLFISTHFAQSRPASEAYLQALASSSGEEWEVAIDALRELARQGGGELLADDAAFLIGQALRAHGRLEEATAAFRSLREAHPDSLLIPEALLNAAQLAHLAGDDDGAMEDLQAILQNFPTGPMAKTAALWLEDLRQGRPLATALK